MSNSAYTSVLQMSLDNITWEDDNFIEELLEVAQLFRPFSDAITEFISEHGFDGDSADVDAKVTFIRTAFEKANMTPPREIREWFIAMQPIKRDTAFLICFAFDLDGGETDEFFRRYYAKERSFKACRAHSMLKWLQGT
mgnify:CR=1 FL=1